jgi:hypothetical protein
MIAPEMPQAATARRRFVAELGRVRASAASQNAALMRVERQEGEPKRTPSELRMRALVCWCAIAGAGLWIHCLAVAAVAIWERICG